MNLVSQRFFLIRSTSFLSFASLFLLFSKLSYCPLVLFSKSQHWNSGDETEHFICHQLQDVAVSFLKVIFQQQDFKDDDGLAIFKS